MNTQKSVTLSGMSGLNFLSVLNAFGMIVVSIYLTTHFYDVLFPTQLGGSSTICNISNFFNCDAATYSPAASLFGVPTSFFGILMGVMILAASIMPSVNFEKTVSAFTKYNFIGCIILFLYSLIVLGSLCPLCSIYYVLSGIAFFLFWKKGINSFTPDLKVTAIFAAITLAGGVAFANHTAGKSDVKSKLNASIVKQFQGLADLGDPQVESPYKIHMATEKFSESPIRISVFSDFECPFCKVVSDQMHELIRRYPKHISIQYMFYPLDNKCNPNVKNKFHVNACDAAVLSACDEKKFVEIHDEIFANQDKIASILRPLAEKHQLTTCFENEEVKNKVISIINGASQYNLKSTPTIIINGKKIEGTVANSQFFAIFDSILNETK